MRLAHLSDLHFGRHDQTVVDALVPELATQNLDLVVISGDFTQLGTESEFQKARAFLEQINGPVFAVPGNHDVPQTNLFTRTFRPYALYRTYVDNELEPFLELDGLAVLGLKTPRRFTPDFNWSNGFLNKRQLAGIEERFSKASPAAMRIIVAHHPLLYPETKDRMVQHTVRRADRALQAFASSGVRLVLSGHFHLSYVRIHGTAGALKQESPQGLRQTTNTPNHETQTTTTTTTRKRDEPNTYNLIEIDGDDIQIDVRE